MQKISLVVALLAVFGGTVRAQSPVDVRAVALVDEMMKAMGGETRWAQTRFLRFDWVVEGEGKTLVRVRHLWDRYQGRYRVEWESREGNKLVALFNVNTRTGRVRVNGEPARDEDEQKYLDQAYGRFINDSYWLLMPWKLKDPGVKLEYAGETRLGGRIYELLHVRFEGVGQTPGDHYWAYINQRTHLMDRWAYFLQSFKGTPSLEKAKSWEWRRWGETGGVRLAREKVRVGENMRIHFPVLMVLEDVEARVFESFEASLPGEAEAKE
ncbi:MAG: DUF6503 family protein [Terriglobia bacterium]